MQVTFTIELKVDYTDRDKDPVMQQAMKQAARHLLAKASLIADSVKPQVIAYSDDIFTGTKEIDIMDDVIQEGINEDPSAGQDAISEDLIKAMRDG